LAIYQWLTIILGIWDMVITNNGAAF